MISFFCLLACGLVAYVLMEVLASGCWLGFMRAGCSFRCRTWGDGLVRWVGETHLL